MRQLKRESGSDYDNLKNLYKETNEFIKKRSIGSCVDNVSSVFILSGKPDKSIVVKVRRAIGSVRIDFYFLEDNKLGHDEYHFDNFDEFFDFWMNKGF